MRYIVLFFLFSVFCKAQDLPKKNKNWIVETGAFVNLSDKQIKTTPGVLIGFYYQFPSQDDVRLELGGNIKFSGSSYNFNYGKKGEVYQVNSNEFVVTLGGRMVKDFQIKNKKIDWISELSLNTFWFSGTGIPNNEQPKKSDDNTYVTYVDVESLSTLQFGQGFRVWFGNVGWSIKGNFVPYSMWYRKTLPEKFNVYSIETSVAFKF